MGQKVNPVGFRVGVVKPWSANSFYTNSKARAESIVNDIKIREYILKKHQAASIAKIIIERTRDFVSIRIEAARVGVLMGKQGLVIDELRRDLKRFTAETIDISVVEVKKPDLQASLIASQIAQQIEKRMSYRRVIKRMIQNSMRSGALGIKVLISGRLNGAEIARSECLKEGSIPLHTLRADIDYALGEALTTYGIIGIKVWVHRKDAPKSRVRNQDKKEVEAA